MREIIILADGEFPSHPIPLEVLHNASFIVCCDGAAETLIRKGRVPDAIVGDIDSLSVELQKQYSNIIHKDSCQETNDLSKAFNYSLTLEPSSVKILGATGLREDHTIGNISLLANYTATADVPVEMLTNYGRFHSIQSGRHIACHKGEQISLFALDTGLRIFSKGLKYPLDNVIFDSWWKATLNECTGESYTLTFSKGRVIIFTAYMSGK